MWETSSALVEPETAPSVTGVRCVVRPSPRPGGRSLIVAAPTRSGADQKHRPGQRLQGGYHPDLAAGSGTARPRSGGHIVGGLPDQPSAGRCLVDLCRPQGSKRGYEERERAGGFWRCTLIEHDTRLRVGRAIAKTETEASCRILRTLQTDSPTENGVAIRGGRRTIRPCC